MNPESARRTILNSDYPLDKQLGDPYSGSFTALARYGAFQPRRTEFSIPHGLGDYAFPNGVYSLNNSQWLELGVINADTSGATPTFQTVEVSAYCTATNLVVIASNYLPGSQTVYYAIQLLSRE